MDVAKMFPWCPPPPPSGFLRLYMYCLVDLPLVTAHFRDYYPVCVKSTIPYSGLFSWVEIFVKSWKRLPELNFVVLNFVA